MSFPVSEVVGKTLTAKIRIPVKRVARDDAEIIGYIPPGGTVGVIYSWLSPIPGIRSSVYFMFYDPQGNTYVTEIKSGWYNIEHLRNQGARTSAQVVEDRRRAAQHFLQNFAEDNASFVTSSASKVVTGLAFGIAMFFVVKALR